MNPKVDFYFDKEQKWQKEIGMLRKIILDCQLMEDLKWGQPCYSFEGRNIVLIHTFKEYCALLFFKGVLLKDAKRVLIQQTPNVQVARQMRFTKAQEIVKLTKTIKAYVFEAVKVEEAGVKVKLKTTAEFDIPAEFKHKLEKNAALKKAFGALTPGRQRAYLYYFSQAKLPKTRETRVEKYVKQILRGKGLED
jgi:uncharacterized protein YdeI (YjbR/CyaY-like superfamily)